MAEGTVTPPPFVGRLTEALQGRLPSASIAAEQVRGDRYRFLVVDESFAPMGHPERQRLVWQVVEEAVDRADIWDVAMVITMSPDEVSDE